jgi:hypothetical protein
MATTPNYGWVTPAPTDFVTDLPADFETFADAVDDTVKDLNPGTTAGDVDYYTSSTAKARLAIGTAGQVLAVNSGATAPEWITVGGGTKNFTLLNTGGTSLSGSSTVTISGISNQDELMLVIVGASSGSLAYNVSLRVNADSSSIYNAWGPYLSAGAGYAASNFGVRSNAGSSQIIIGEWSDNAASAMSGFFRISGAATSGKKIVNFATGSSASGGNGQDLVWGGGWIDLSSTITSISLIQTESINFDAGTAYLYGSA